MTGSDPSVCTPPSSVHLFGSGRERARLDKPRCQTLELLTAAIDATFLLLSRRWSWCCTVMSFGILVCQEESRGRRESCNTGQIASPQFLAKQKHICQTKRSRLKEPPFCREGNNGH